MNHQKILIKFLLIFTFMVSFCFVFAQGIGDPGGPPGGTAHSAVPLDSGLALLLGAGVMYGVKKGYDNRKNGN